MDGIAVPGVKMVQHDSEVDRGSRPDEHVFNRGKSFIRYVHPSEEELDLKNLYDMDRLDDANYSNSIKHFALHHTKAPIHDYI